MLPDGHSRRHAGALGFSGRETQYTSEPFGKTTVVGSSNSNLYAFTGRENDLAGLYYYRSRYYNPTLQPFVSPGPMGFAAGDANLYAYVGNNPVNLVDPLGLKGGPAGPRTGAREIRTDMSRELRAGQ